MARQTQLTPVKTPRSFKAPIATHAAGMGSSAKFFTVVRTASMVQEANRQSCVDDDADVTSVLGLGEGSRSGP